MKRLLALFCILAALTGLAATAYADVLWEPNNNFYEKHSSECTYIGRAYYANGSKGFVTLWDAPGGGTVIAQYENGNKLWVYWQYRDWGCITVWGDEGHIDGWIRMSDLYLIYDHISFEEEYGKYFKDYDGEFADYDESNSAGNLETYEYPFDPLGATGSIAPSQDILDALRGTPDTPSYISKVYRQRDGTVWGYVNYLFGYRNFWLDLTNPTGDGKMCCECNDETVIMNLIDTGELTAPQTPVMPAVSRTPYFLVGGVVAVTLGLLWRFYAKRSK